MLGFGVEIRHFKLCAITLSCVYARYVFKFNAMNKNMHVEYLAPDNFLSNVQTTRKLLNNRIPFAPNISCHDEFQRTALRLIRSSENEGLVR